MARTSGRTVARTVTRTGGRTGGRPGMGVRSRLVLVLGITAALSVAGTALITFGLVRRYAGQVALQDLARQASVVATDTIERESTGTAPRTAVTAAVRQLLSGSGDRVLLLGNRGEIVSADPTATDVAEHIDAHAVLAGRRIQGTVRVSEGEFAYVAEPVPGRRPGTGIAGVMLARSVGLAANFWRPVISRVLVAGAIAVAIAIALSLWIARRLSGPLRRVAEASKRVAAGDLTQRVPVEGGSEVADVARQFNGMAEALSEARRREHEFLANVSHELRTPLTAIRGYAEALADGTAAGTGAQAEAAKVIGDESDRLELLLRDVIDLARLGARELRLELRPVTLDTTCQEAVAAHGARAAEAGVSLTDNSDPALASVVVTTDPLRVRQIVSNLVDNALRVTPAGGSVRVGGHPSAGELVVEVADTGPGIAPGDLAHVFERSYLWGRSKGAHPVGTGLGLAIVRELAVALGGRIEVESQLGHGTRFLLHLPLRPADRSLSLQSRPTRS